MSRIRQSGLFNLEFDLISTIGQVGYAKPIIRLSELWIVGLVVTPCTVGGDHVLAFKSLDPSTRVIAVIHIKEDFHTVINPGLSVFAPRFSGVGDDLIVSYVDRHIDSLIIMGYPGEKTVVVPGPCIVSRGDVVNPVVWVDVDSLGALVLLIVDYPVDLRGVGFRGGVGSALK